MQFSIETGAVKSLVQQAMAFGPTLSAIVNFQQGTGAGIASKDRTLLKKWQAQTNGANEAPDEDFILFTYFGPNFMKILDLMGSKMTASLTVNPMPHEGSGLRTIDAIDMSSEDGSLRIMFKMTPMSVNGFTWFPPAEETMLFQHQSQQEGELTLSAELAAYLLTLHRMPGDKTGYLTLKSSDGKLIATNGTFSKTIATDWQTDDELLLPEHLLHFLATSQHHLTWSKHMANGQWTGAMKIVGHSLANGYTFAAPTFAKKTDSAAVRTSVADRFKDYIVD